MKQVYNGFFQLHLTPCGSGFWCGTDLTVAEIEHALPFDSTLCQGPSWPATYSWFAHSMKSHIEWKNSKSIVLHMA